jgi:hypothetical protein
VHRYIGRMDNILFLRAFVALVIALAAIEESRSEAPADLQHESAPGAAAAPGLPPPYVPHSEDAEQSVMPLREIAMVVAPSAAPTPFFGDATQMPIRRPWQPNLSASDSGSGHAAWMAHAAAAAARVSLPPDNSTPTPILTKRDVVGLFAGGDNGWMA